MAIVGLGVFSSADGAWRRLCGGVGGVQIGLAGGCWRLAEMFVGREGVGRLSSVRVCWPGGRVDVGGCWVCWWVGLANWLWMLLGRRLEVTMGSVGQTEYNTTCHGQ